MKKFTVLALLLILGLGTLALASSTVTQTGDYVEPRIVYSNTFFNATPADPVTILQPYSKFVVYTVVYGPTPGTCAVTLKVSPDKTNFFQAVTMSGLTNGKADSGTTPYTAQVLQLFAGLTPAATSTPASSPTPSWTATATPAVKVIVIGTTK